MSEYETQDSGQRQEYPSGMVRDVQEGKPRYDLLDDAFLERWALLMARGAGKYGEENWQLADSLEEYRRFRASAARHAAQWLRAEKVWERTWNDPNYVPTKKEQKLMAEDHAAAAVYNYAAAAYVKERLKRPKPWEPPLFNNHISTTEEKAVGPARDWIKLTRVSE